MPSYSASSLAKLATCHPKLQKVFRAVIQEMDHTIVCGWRGEVEQNKAFAEGFSKLKWDASRHNPYPSEAIDVAPYTPGVGIDWSDHAAFLRLSEIVLRKAKELGIELTWGGSWGDMPHYELKK